MTPREPIPWGQVRYVATVEFQGRELWASACVDREISEAPGADRLVADRLVEKIVEMAGQELPFDEPIKVVVERPVSVAEFLERA